MQGMAVAAAEHWSEDKVEKRRSLADNTLKIGGNEYAKRTPTKGKLKHKSCCIRKSVSVLVFCTCYCPSWHLAWLNYVLEVCVLRFYNLYSGEFKFLYLARARRCFERLTFV